MMIVPLTVFYTTVCHYLPNSDRDIITYLYASSITGMLYASVILILSWDSMILLSIFIIVTVGTICLYFKEDKNSFSNKILKFLFLFCVVLNSQNYVTYIQKIELYFRNKSNIDEYTVSELDIDLSDVEEVKDYLTALEKEECLFLNREPKMIEVINSGDETEKLGWYSDNVITININGITSLQELHYIYFHESFHALQNKLMQNAADYEDGIIMPAIINKYKYEQAFYKDNIELYDEYSNQRLEVDSREYGYFRTEMVSEVIDSDKE